MTPPSITTTLALESDASTLASILTAGFVAGDAAYPLIWGAAPEGMHEEVSVKGLFTPVQKEGRATYKAVDSTTGNIVGFATWTMPRPKVEGEEKKKGGLPDLPGVNMELWNVKAEGPKKSYYRDVQIDKDYHLNFCFVHPDYQRQGIASLLLNWGTQKADEAHAKLWVVSTPQAIKAYEKSGFKVVEVHEIDLSKYGGKGVYRRAWMLRSATE